jgi:hypothetical protein
MCYSFLLDSLHRRLQTNKAFLTIANARETTKFYSRIHRRRTPRVNNAVVPTVVFFRRLLYRQTCTYSDPYTTDGQSTPTYHR